MKKVFSIIALLSACAFAYAQDAQQAAADAAAEIANAPQEAAAAPKPKYWTTSVEVGLGLNQTYFENWASGGFNNVNFTSSLDAKADYAKALASWNNRLQMQYAFLWSEDKEGIIQKSNDVVYFQSKFGYKTGEGSKWSYTASYDFRSQFSSGYTYNAPDKTNPDLDTWKKARVLKSGFLSPAYNNLALGMEWVPNKWFSINIAPIAGSITHVDIPELRKNYGMELKSRYENPKTLEDTLAISSGTAYKSSKMQFGGQLKANLKFTINDNFNFESQLTLFSDYLDKPQNLRVNWDTGISWQLSKYLKLSANTWLIYDPNVLIAAKNDPDDLAPRTQFKEFLSFSFTYTFKK